MALDERYVMTLRSHRQGQVGNEFDNVFAFRQNSEDGDAQELNSTWISEVFPLLRPMVNEIITFDELYTICLDDPTDFHLYSIGLGGTSSGDYLPDFCSWTFEYVRPIREINNGRKAIPGVSEAHWTGSALSGGAVAGIPALAAAFGDSVGAPAAQWIPCIWRRAGDYLVGGVPTPFPDTFYDITLVRFTTVSTQNTRKR